jgi:hypothetical protein
MGQSFKERLDDLESLIAIDDNKKQKRGLKFEKLVLDIFEYHKFLIRRSYHTQDNMSEQIDGAVEFAGQIALIEAKWKESNIAASELYSFCGKIENKFIGTIGIFISKEDLTTNFMGALNKGRRQAVIVLHGEDIDDIVKKDFPLEAYLIEARRQLSTDNITHLPTREFLKEYYSKAKKINISSDIRSQCRQTLNKIISQEIIDTNSLLIDVESECNSDEKLFILKYLLKEVRNLDFSRVYVPITQRNYRIVAVINKLLEDNELVTRSWDVFCKNFQSAPRNYIRETFFNQYQPIIDKLKGDEFIDFSNALLKAWELVFNDWNLENVLAETTDRIWDKLRQDEKDKILEYIFEIASDKNRKDQFPQKQFAKKMIRQYRRENKSLLKRKVFKWVRRKVEDEKEKYGEIRGSSRINVDIKTNAIFFAESYDALRENLMLDDDEWIRKVKSIYKAAYGD